MILNHIYANASYILTNPVMIVGQNKNANFEQLKLFSQKLLSIQHKFN